MGGCGLNYCADCPIEVIDIRCGDLQAALLPSVARGAVASLQINWKPCMNREIKPL
jgi:hypothetical protein